MLRQILIAAKLNSDATFSIFQYYSIFFVVIFIFDVVLNEKIKDKHKELKTYSEIRLVR